METLDISQSEEIFTVSRLNREARFVLEGSFPLLWVEGEISNFSVPSSGHWYFSLKDSGAQVRCALFKPNNRRLGFTPKDGMQVLMKARVSLYEGRGEFQLIGEHIEEMGEGMLRQAFDALKKRLQAEGLFATEHKKPLPTLPKSIGVITSPTGAAIRDIISVLRRRFPSVPVTIYPTLVQGETAAPNIVNAIRIANSRNECDVLILARGGGSLEDLWPFNEEMVAQAIFKSVIPLISGIGHEVDFTIADFVADVRAPTPSAAAELITPDTLDLLHILKQASQRLIRNMRHALQQLQQNLDWAGKQLQHQHPKRRLLEQHQRLDLFRTTLFRLQQQYFNQQLSDLATLQMRLNNASPLHQVREAGHSLRLQTENLKTALSAQVQQLQQRLGAMAAKLDALSPLATLQRGFAITTHNERVVQSVEAVKPGDAINVRLADGSLACTVNNIFEDQM